MKYANYDKTGKLLGWYDKEIHSTIPTPNIEVSDEQWQKALENGYNFIDATKKTLGKKDFRTFAQLQTVKLSELKIAYNKANETDIAYMNTTFQADKKSQDLIVSVLSAGSVPSGFYWFDKANNQVAMTYADLQGLSGAILARGQVNFTKLQGLKAKVKSAKTQTALNKIKWS